MIKILIIDDERRLVEAFKRKLLKEGLDVSTAYTAKQALSMLNANVFDVGVLDIRLPDIEGTELLSKIKELQPTMEIIMLTGYASVETAIKSMKLGAYDYLTKPCTLSRLHSIIVKAYEKKSLHEKNIILQEQLNRVDVRDQFIGKSKPAQQAMKQVALVATSDMPVLVTGETGTGKELIARAIHKESPRSANPFVAVNSSTLQESLLESELFGYKKGAFTGAQGDKIGLLEIANKGTFFIDEVGDMNPGIQAKFLRVLETGTFRRLGDTREVKVNVRFVCATNKNLKAEVQEKKFRKDLYYRLNTFVLSLPALRDRKEDIPLLSEYLLRKFTKGKGKHISGKAMELLMEYRWPGNVRELANVIERAILLSFSRDEITVDDLRQSILNDTPDDEGCRDFELPENILTLQQLEAKYIEHVMNLSNNNKSKVAKLLGISRSQLYQKIKK